MHSVMNFRRGMIAACCISAFLLCACDDTESSIVLPQEQTTSTSATTTTISSSVSADGTTTAETTTLPNETTISASESTSLTSDATSATTTTATSADTDKDGYLLDMLTIGDDCTAYVKQHTDYTLQEAASCLGDGTDRVYYYADRVLYTCFDGTTDILMEIDITADTIATRNGATIGMTQSEVEALHGTPTDGTYLTVDGTLEFIYADNTVVRIAIYNPY